MKGKLLLILLCAIALISIVVTGILIQEVPMQQEEDSESAVSATIIMAEETPEALGRGGAITQDYG